MVAREKNTIHERHHTSRWQTFRWQGRRRSTEDAPRVEESIDTAREENEDLTDFFDGKEDEDAQKTLRAWKKA